MSHTLTRDRAAKLGDVAVPMSPWRRRNPYSIEEAHIWHYGHVMTHVEDLKTFVNTIHYPTDIVTQPPTHARGRCQSVFIGQTPYSITAEQLKFVLEAASGARIVALRPQFRKGCNRTQVTGCWFVDCAVGHQDMLLDLSHRLLLHVDRVTIVARHGREELLQWVKVRDATVAIPGIRGVLPMVVDPPRP